MGEGGKEISQENIYNCIYIQLYIYTTVYIYICIYIQLYIYTTVPAWDQIPKECGASLFKCSDNNSSHMFLFHGILKDTKQTKTLFLDSLMSLLHAELFPVNIYLLDNISKPTFLVRFNFFLYNCSSEKYV